MNLVDEGWQWLLDPANWTGASGISNRLAEHITVTFAALLVAALGAEGESRIEDLHHIDRGYQCLEGDLAALGARIRRVAEDRKT